MELFSEPLLEKWQQTITHDYCRSHNTNAWLFRDKEEFFNFILGCVGEGIAKAISQQEAYDAEKGSFYFFCSLKSFEVIRDELRKEHRRRKCTSTAVLKELYLLRPGLADQVNESDLRGEQQYRLKDLSKDQRDVLLLVDYLGCPPKEVASILKRKVEAVYSLLKRARRKAAEAYEEEGPRSLRGSRKPRDKLMNGSETR